MEIKRQTAITELANSRIQGYFDNDVHFEDACKQMILDGNRGLNEMDNQELAVEYVDCFRPSCEVVVLD